MSIGELGKFALMKEFPQRLTLPSEVSETRDLRQKELTMSAFVGIFIRLGIIAFEFFGVWLYGSSSLLMDALASLVDVGFSLILVFCIFYANRPPDRNHPFGHGRVEPLMGLQMSVMLCVIGGFMLWQFFQTTTTDIGHQITGPAWIFPVVAVVMLEICYRVIMRSAEKQNSPALVADAIHYRIDAITSLFAAFALILAAFIPQWGALIDHLGAMLIALIMVGLGIYAARENLHQLMDKTPDREFFELVEAAAKKVDGVLGTEKVGIQVYGPDAHVYIDIEVDPILTVEIAHRISQQVRLEIQKEWPAVRDVIVHIEPYYPNDH